MTESSRATSLFMRALLLTVLLFAPTAALAGQCGYVNSHGDQVSWIDNTDYDFALKRADGGETLCVLLRSPEQTSGSCDDGTDTEFFYASSKLGGEPDLLVFDHWVWYSRCE